MGPNYQFEKEISKIYGLDNVKIMEVCNRLLKKHKAIDQKEYDIIMHICAYYKKSSILRQSIISEITKKEVLLTQKLNNNNQQKIQF